MNLLMMMTVIQKINQLIVVIMFRFPNQKMKIVLKENLD